MNEGSSDERSQNSSTSQVFKTTSDAPKPRNMQYDYLKNVQ